MANNQFTLKECIEIVNCCYFVGSCHACPASKPTGYANICRCVGPQKVGEALLHVLEPLHELEKAKQPPTLFDIPEDVPEEDPEIIEPEIEEIEAEPIEEE